MAGDRGLALVILGLIAASLLPRLARPQGSAENELSRQSGTGMVRDVARRITGDYRSFHEQMERLAVINVLSAPFEPAAGHFATHFASVDTSILNAPSSVDTFRDNTPHVELFAAPGSSIQDAFSNR